LDDEWVTIDSRIPNALIKEALEKESIPEFHGFRLLRSEPTFGKARLDFLLHPPCLVEVKGCTLVRNSVALFPDAPTDRGTRHLMELAKAVSEGYRACILFVVQRSGATALVPNQETDPKFSLALREAMEKGVEALAYRSCYRKGEIVLGGRVDVRV
jgi:sugar fermentation stimulation protein A